MNFLVITFLYLSLMTNLNYQDVEPKYIYVECLNNTTDTTYLTSRILLNTTNESLREYNVEGKYLRLCEK